MKDPLNNNKRIYAGKKHVWKWKNSIISYEYILFRCLYGNFALFISRKAWPGKEFGCKGIGIICIYKIIYLDWVPRRPSRVNITRNKSQPKRKRFLPLNCFRRIRFTRVFACYEIMVIISCNFCDGVHKMSIIETHG